MVSRMKHASTCIVVLNPTTIVNHDLRIDQELVIVKFVDCDISIYPIFHPGYIQKMET